MSCLFLREQPRAPGGCILQLVTVAMVASGRAKERNIMKTEMNEFELTDAELEGVSGGMNKGERVGLVAIAAGATGPFGAVIATGLALAEAAHALLD
jgi:hypothetical protein